MKKIILEKLIYRDYLKTALTSLLFIEIALIFLYFNASNKMVKESVNFMMNDIKKNIYSIVENEKFHLQHELNSIENILYVIQNEQQSFFKYYMNSHMDFDISFKYAKNGMFYKDKDNNGSSVIVSKDVKVDEDLLKKLIYSEVFDKSFKSIVNNHEMVSAVYFNSHDNFSRYYPFISDVYNVFPSSFEIEKYNFYSNASKKNNPEKKVVWTDVYLDPARQGWMISAIVPIYNEEFLEGVSGIDITLENLINSFIKLKLPHNGSSFIMNKSGKIIVMTKEIENFLSIKEKKETLFSKKIEKTILKNDMLNIFDYSINSDIKEKLQKAINTKEYANSIYIDSKDFLLYSKKIEKLDWYIISLIDENAIISQTKELEKYYREIGYLMIVFIIIFYLIFFIFLYGKAKDFVRTINTPLLKIIDLTKELGRKKDIKKVQNCGIIEIDTLNENFNNLIDELEDRTKKLIKEESKRIRIEELANTDVLTQVYNRRFLDDFSNNYIKILKREKKTFSLLLIDLDDFKKINDKFGHDMGDKTLRMLVKYLKETIRENDIIVRFGGDEFLVMLPNTYYENAMNVAQKILSNISLRNKLKESEVPFTVSIGVSQFKESDIGISDVIKRADLSLYKAKNKGKNCVV